MTTVQWAMVVAGLVGAQLAGAQTIVYETDFETLNPGAFNCINGAGTGPAMQYGTFSADYSTPSNPYTQHRTADRLCTTAVAGGTYTDPANPANRHAGGLVSGRSSSWIEAVSITFDPQGEPFLNLAMDWSLVNLPAQPVFQPTAPRDVVARYYRLPPGHAITLSDGGVNPANVFVNGAPATPVTTRTMAISRSSYAAANQYTFDWRPQRDALDLSALGLATGDRIGVVFHLVDPGGGNGVYAAFDNLRVTASQTAGGVTITVSAPDNTTDTTPIITGTSSEANATVTLTITDSAGVVQTFTTTTDGSGNYALDLGTQAGAQPLAIGTYTAVATVPNPFAPSAPVTATDPGSVVATAMPAPAPVPVNGAAMLGVLAVALSALGVRRRPLRSAAPAD